jgi:glycosyltransferase involved in cell wall biosynthesis
MHSPLVLEQQINWSGQGWQGRLKMALGTRRLKSLEARLIRSCAAIHTLSDFTRSWIQRLHGLGNNVTVIPHWNRPDFRRTLSKAQSRQRLGWPLNKKIVFTVRGLRPRYGLDTAIKAIAPLVADGGTEFFIGGDGELRSTLEQLIVREQASDRIHLLGRLTDEHLRWSYQAADLFVLPTLALECFGLISVESLAFGCAVVASEVAAIPEVLRPILPNCLVPPGDVSALRNKIRSFLDGSLAVPDEQVLVAYVQQNYSREIIWPQMARLLTGLDG